MRSRAARPVLPDRSGATTPSTYVVGRRTLTALFAGRGAFRLAQLGANVILLPLWGNERYGTYAAAVATFTWLIALLQSGPEKTVLKLLPRAPRTGPLVTEALLALLWCLPIPLLLAFGVVTLVDGGGAVSLYAGVAVMAVGSGCLLLLAGLHRVMGRPHYDSRSAATMAVAQIALVGLAALGMGPLAYVATFAVVQTAVNTLLLVRLGRPSLRIRRRRGFLAKVLWTTAFMGTPEVCLYLVTSVLFSVLAASRWSDQVGPLFAATLVWSAGVTFLIYGLRVYAPYTSHRLLGNGEEGRAMAARMARWAIAYDLAWLGVMLVLLETTDLQSSLTSDAAFFAWGAVLVTRSPSVMLLLPAGFLIENSDARAPRITAVGSVACLAAAGAAGAWLVPLYGGAGLIAAAMAGEVVQALVFVELVRRRGSGRPRSGKSSLSIG